MVFVLVAPKEEVQKIATDSEILADGISRVPDTRSQKAQVRTRGGDFRPAALVQLGNGTMARDEEEAEIALPVAATVEGDMSLLKRWAGPAWIKATQTTQTFTMERAMEHWRGCQIHDIFGKTRRAAHARRHQGITVLHGAYDGGNLVETCASHHEKLNDARGVYS